ncbi:MAG: DsbA family oxidoreductase, partial [Pseudomonadota bacterium]
MSRIDILSDPICPWCYIGKTHLDRALAARPGHGLTIEWHPFQLNPEMSPEGVDRKAYLETKFGGPDGAAQVYGRIEEAAKSAGLEIHFDRIARTPNTIDAHRLIHWAGLEDRQHALKGALFVAYFEQGRDIGDKDTLAEIAGEVGMDAAMTRHLL